MEELIINTKTYTNLHKVAKQYDQEMVGVLIGLRAKNYLYIFHARITGRGESTSVASEEKAIDAINYVLQKYPELDAITFHTHPLALGPSWQERLSKGDIENLKHEPNQRTVLVSGTGVYEFKLTSLGLSSPKRIKIQDLELESLKLIEEWEAKVISEINSKF
ncbi:MAG: hypothetical protein PHF86_10145 [Candidatus Nanoarchaeia archaeon]|nr:hypothetical protein [Candidatus Nanoarchaeia archaeon]